MFARFFIGVGAQVVCLQQQADAGTGACALLSATERMSLAARRVRGKQKKAAPARVLRVELKQKCIQCVSSNCARQEWKTISKCM
jgi:hypothetical protein